MRYWLGILAYMLLALCGQAWAQGMAGTLVAPAIGNYAPCYSPDGKWIAYLRGTDAQHCDELWVMDATGKNARVLLTRETMRYALTRIDLVIHGATATTEELRRQDAAPPASQSPVVRRYVWHPTSQSLLCQISSERSNGGVYQVMLDGSFRQVPHPLGYLYSMPVISWGDFLLSPDGKEIAFIGNQGWFRASLDDKEPLQMKFHSGYTCHEANWGTDGRIYCAMTPTAQDEIVPSGIYALTPDGTLTPVMKPDGERSPALSPDGKWLAYLRNQNLLVREQATGKETTVSSDVTGYRWLPSGYLLATTNEVTAEQWSDGRTLYFPFTSKMREEIRVINPGSYIPELCVLYRTTHVPSFILFGSSDRVILDWMQTPNAAIRNFFTFLNTLPDISPDGKRLVYTWEGALCLMDVPTKQDAQPGQL